MKFVFKVIGIVIVLSSNKVLGLTAIEEDILLKSLLKGYDPNIPPEGGTNGTGPVEVKISFYLRHMDDIDDTKMVYDVQLDLIQCWLDDRLKYDTIEDLKYVTVTREGIIWVPDSYFSNEYSGHRHNIIKPNILVRIFPDGQVLYNTRISLRLFCQVDLHNYPLDNQVCQMVLGSYAYSSQDLNFHWRKSNGIQLKRNLALRKFELNAYSLSDCTALPNTGTVACLIVKFFLARSFHTFLKDVYIPTTCLVLLSWLVLWINPKNSIIRFGIWIGTLVMMFILVVSLRFKTPETPYIKSIDIWIGSCLTFLYLVGIELWLVESAVENNESEFTKQSKIEGDDSEKERNSMKLEDTKVRKQLQDYCAVPLRWYNSSSKKQRIDVVFRVVYPLTFIIFTFVYWIVHSVNQELCEGGGECFEVKPS